jgi:chemotaxis protein MotB
MGKNPFEEMDPDLKAMGALTRPSGGSVRWARVATGVLVVATLTFAFAFYLPLREAHQALTKLFSELQSQVETANRDLQIARREAKDSIEKQQALQEKIDQAKQLEKSADPSAIKSALEAKLTKQLAKDQAALGTADGQAVAALSLSYVLTKGKLAVSPDGKAALCSVASAANKKTIRVLAIADKASIPPALGAKLKTPLDYSSAVATLVAQTLLEKCSVEPAHVSATGFPVEPANPKLEAKKLAGGRVELWLDTK